MQLFVKKLLNYRKDSKAIIEGKTIHFAPENGVYVLFRVLENETVAVILNKNKKLVKLNLERFDELGLKGRNLKNIITSEKVVWKDYLTLKGEGVIILTTK